MFKSKTKWKQYLAENIGVCILIFIVCIYVLINSIISKQNNNNTYGGTFNSPASSNAHSIDVNKFLGQKLLKTAWSATDHSNANDIKDHGVGNQVVDKSPDNEIQMILNSNHDLQLTLNPIYAKNPVIIHRNWQVTSEGKIILDRDIFARVTVFSMDLNGDVNTYIYIPGILEVTDNSIKLDLRESNRGLFIAQLAKKAVIDHVSEDQYAEEVLKNLSLSAEYITQYLYFLGPDPSGSLSKPQPDITQPPIATSLAQPSSNLYISNPEDEKQFETYNGKIFDLTGVYYGKSIMGYDVGVAKLTILKDGSALLDYNHGESGQATEAGQIIPKSRPTLYKSNGMPFYEFTCAFKKASGGEYDIVVQITDDGLKTKKIVNKKDTTRTNKPDSADNDDMQYAELSDNQQPIQGELSSPSINRAIYLTGLNWKVSVVSAISKQDIK